MDTVEFLNQLYRRYKFDPEYYSETINLNNMEPIPFVANVETWAREHPIKTENQNTYILKEEEMFSLYPEKAQHKEKQPENLCPIGIMWFMASDPNQTDEVPGEWELVSKLWKRIG